MPDAPPHTLPRALGLAGAAAALHGAFDAATFRLPWIGPPYLKLEDASEAFRFLSPLTVSVATSCVSGVIAAIAAGALEPSARRTGPLAALVTGFWLFSALLSWLLWFETPWPAAVAGLAAGVPRGLAVGLVLARIAGPPRVSAAPA